MTNPRRCAKGTHPRGSKVAYELKPEAWHTRKAAGPQELGLVTGRSQLRQNGRLNSRPPRAVYYHSLFWTTSFFSDNFILQSTFCFVKCFLAPRHGWAAGRVSRYKLRFKYRHITMPSRMLKGNCPVV